MPVIGGEKFELVGVGDGTTTDYTTTQDYRSNTVHLHDPLMQPQTEIQELGGNRVRISPAPPEGTNVFISYRIL